MRSTGVTVVSSTRVQIVVASGAPTLYYYCNVQEWEDNTPVPFNGNLKVTTTNQSADNIIIINTLRLMMFYLVQRIYVFTFKRQLNRNYKEEKIWLQ